MNGHTSFRLHKRIFVVLHSGESFIDRLTEQRSGAYVFRERGRVAAKAIRTMAYFKGGE